MNAAVILAAGESRRMGRAKALLGLNGVTFLEHIINAVRSAAIDNVLVAVAHDDPKILKICELHGVYVIHNTATPVAVPLGSIQAAVSQVINQSVESLLVWPVDQPHVRPSTASGLLTAFLRFQKAVTVPVFGGRRGHPVVFGRSVFDELLAAPPDLGARAVVRADPGRVCEVAVDDPAVLDDIDTPADYEALLARFRP